MDLARLEREYYERRPDLGDPTQLVSFGTSGHRGSPLNGSFTEAHILAITQAICDYRRSRGYDGPLYMGKDTHAVSGPAQRTALEVLAANRVETIIQSDDGFTPTPVISRAILVYNRNRKDHLADGIVITPSHNPPADGGFKYNPPNGGPADTDVTRWVERRANELLGNRDSVKRLPFAAAIKAETTHQQDFVLPYVERPEKRHRHGGDSQRGSEAGCGSTGRRGRAVLGADQLRLSFGYRRREHDHRSNLLVHDRRSRRQDTDGSSSPYAMARLVDLKNQYDVAFANDPDSDRHGIVTPSSGLMNPNHYLAVAIRYLLTHRPNWPAHVAVGKTLVSSSMIDRVVDKLGRSLCEVPVGFKWFVPGLFDGSLCFGGEESAGASFLRKDGTVWTTDKDGPIMDLLAAEITARTGKDPGELYQELTTEFGTAYYTRIDAPATPEQKARLQKLSPESIATDAHSPASRSRAKLTSAPGNGAPIGGLKVVTDNGWFAARPSGTENIYKIYAESFKDEGHLAAIVQRSARNRDRCARSPDSVLQEQEAR